MKTASVHIVLSDTGWVLEKLASQLAGGIPSVAYSLEPDPSATIQYYMTYATWKSRISRIEVGYFAHMEPDDRTKKKFFDVARSVDFCVCHSAPYETILRDEGIEAVKTIPPGVDLQSFVPKVKIGIVGRTYHTGRKGEGLVAQVMDIPHIEWYFTGTGWPGPATELADADMPAFYRSMDYILVPSLYEGGPMSVIEALACGCEVIAPPIGWVPEFPHIEYKTGDADDLRRVLVEVVEKRLALRKAVLQRGWDTWIEGHASVFESLVRGSELSTQVVLPYSDIKPTALTRPAIIVHGSETGVDKGGPSVRAPETVKRLVRLGYDAKLLESLTFDQRDYDTYHIFNLSRTSTCRRAIEFSKLSASPVILSTIYLDPSERQISEVDITDIFRHSFSPSMVNEEYARIREGKIRRLQLGKVTVDPKSEEFNAEVRQLIGSVDHIICLSEHERRLLDGIGADVSRSTIVRNPVEAAQFADATPDLFTETYNVTDYVLCVGRLEPRKNQITLLHALRGLNIPLVLIGHAPDPQYKQLLRSVAGPNATFIDRLPPSSRMLASAFAGARVFCLPSWSEGAPLAALEAAAAGSNMVLSDRSSEQEYFGARSRYCDPGNPEQMAIAIQEAFEKPFSPPHRAAQSQWIAENFSWEKYAAETAAVYEGVASRYSGRGRGIQVDKARRKIYIDLTSGANRSGPPSGIARVEERYALDLYDLLPGQVSFIIWNSYRRAFIEISHEQFVQNKHKKLHNIEAPGHLFNQRNLAPYASVAFEPNSILLVLGGAWIRNENYIHSLSATKRVHKMSLVVFVHDVIQGKFKHWFPENIGNEFTRNCRLIINVTDHVIVNSKCTLDDLREISAAENMVCPPVDILRFGDEIEKVSAESERPQFDEILPLIKGKPFVLYVSALDIRKNHSLLYNVWERMLKQYGDKTPHLIMVGSKGWNVDHFLGLVKENEAITKVFHILHGINDATLSWLYRYCLFTVYPSHYEGWGLPVAESLNYGKVCIAARAGSVPEIAPEVTDLIDPLDFVAWYKAITNYVFNANQLKARRQFVVDTYKPLTWRASAERLRDLLLQVGGGGRPLPVVRIGQNLPFDDRSGNNSREIKIGGWYSPEKDGTWTLGALATLQFKLEGVAEGALVLDIAGRGFILGRDDFQIATVACQGVALGEIKWNGDFASDLFIIPPALAGQMLADEECILELRIVRPLIPANVRSNSTDKRQLGVMVRSIGLRPANTAPLDSWNSANTSARKVVEVEKPLLMHRSVGGHGYKLPLLIESSIPDEALRFGKLAFVGFRLAIIDEAPAEQQSLLVELRIGADRLGEVQLIRGEVTASFFAVPSAYLKSGAVVEIGALRGNIAHLSIVDYGVFSSPIGQEIVSLPANMMVDLTKGQDRKAAKGGTPPHWGLDRMFQSGQREALAPAFIAGWSRLEAGGIWSDGERAGLLMRIHAPANEPMLLSFEVRAYQTMRVNVRVNGAASQVWVFDSSTFQKRVLVHHPEARDNGIVFVEFEFRDAVCPADVEGSTDTRKLGIFLASFAALTLDFFSLLAKRTKFPVLDRMVLVDCATPAVWAAGPAKGEAALAVLGAAEAAPMLLAGWAKSEKAGSWSDGEIACLYIRPKPDSAKEGGLLLSFDARPFRPATARIRVNGGEAQELVFPSTKNQNFVIKFPAGSGEDGYLVQFEILGAVAPSDVGEGADQRRLGLYLGSFGLIESQARLEEFLAKKAKLKEAPKQVAAEKKPAPPAQAAKDLSQSVPPKPAEKPPEVQKPQLAPPVGGLHKTSPASPRMAPVIMDFSREMVHPSVVLSNWYDSEVHGRWSRGTTGVAEISLPAKAEGPVKLAVVLRLTGSAKIGPRTVTLLVDGKACGSVEVINDDFCRLVAVVSVEVAEKTRTKIEFRCSASFNPLQFGESEDSRDLGVHVRGAVLGPDDPSKLPEFLVPGLELVQERV